MRLPHFLRRHLLWIVLLVVLLHPPAIISAATFTVTNSLNTGAGSLRQAITNANASAGGDVIVFDPAGAPYSIPLLSPLLITDNAGVLLDGWSAGGAGYAGPPLVEINGTGVIGAAGLLITSANNTVRGLALNRMSTTAYAIQVTGAAAQNNWIYGCYIGTDTSGTVELQNQQIGIVIANNAANNRVGTNSDGVNDAAERNLVSGNRLHGIALSSAHNNQVSGNYIGTDITGTVAICNGCTGMMHGGDGILIEAASTANIIGTNGDGVNDALEGNLISGTEVSNNGVFIRDTGTSDNRVAGNLIGTNATGTAALPNGGGISITYGATNNIIGTDGDGLSDTLERNIISGNIYHGVELLEDGTTGNRVAGNYIGTTGNGLAALPNRAIGVVISPGTLPGGPVNNIIGTDGDGSPGDVDEGNVIAGNWSDGVAVAGVDTVGNIIAGNLIGTDSTGTLDIGNGGAGVVVYQGATNTRVGVANLPVERNLISGNSRNGVIVSDVVTNKTTVTGNQIGTDISGTLAIPNVGSGVMLNQATTVTVGDTAPGTGNTIRYNTGHGIWISGAVASAENNIIQNNNQAGIRVEPYFGLNASPATAADDRLAEPPLHGNQIDGNCVALPPAMCAGIFAMDTAPQNAATLELDNTIGVNNGANDVEQRWYGALEIISGNVPVAGAATIVSSAGTAYPMTADTTCAGVMNNTILHGTQPLSCVNAPTWTQFAEFVVSPAGVRITHVPHTIAAPLTTYSYDADAATNPTDSGFGFVGEGITTGTFSRYQVMETTQSDALPTVVATTPANGAVGVALNTDVVISFSEDVTVSGAWITINCTLSGNHNVVMTGGPQDYTLNPTADFVLSDVCTVTVTAAQVEDQDYPLDNMAADYVFTFGVVDAPPFVASTTPADGAADIPVNGDITLTFSEMVMAGAGWFDITCSTSGNHAGTVTNPLPSVTYTIDPTVNFAYSETCTVTVFAAQVSDIDLPADTLAADYTFSFTTAAAPQPGYASAPVNPGGTINFGQVLVGQSATRTLTITENGDADLVVNSFVLANPSFAATSLPALPATIVDGSGGTITLTLTCTPISTGMLTSTLSVAHNAPGGIADYNLTCQGIVPRPTAAAPDSQPVPNLAGFDPAISKIGFLQPGQIGTDGELLEWVVTVTNPSGVAGLNVVFTDTLRPELRIERVETSKGSINANGQMVTVEIGTLAPGEGVQISIFTTVIAGGIQVDNTACLHADNLTGERCATGSAIGSLPATGETPFLVFWGIRLGLLLVAIGIARWIIRRHDPAL